MTLPVDELLDRISATLRDLPGAVELYLFGSMVDPETRDSYSDLDLQILSNDYHLSLQAWPWILNQAGEMELVYLLSDQPHETAYCISFANESPYHKVDIGIYDKDNPGFFQNVKKKVLLWEKSAKTEPVFFSSGRAYLPEMGSVNHFLMGELIGSIRYLKARKRRQHLTCWRFISAKFNALLRCSQWKGDDQKFPANLNTWDFIDLDRLLPEAERLVLLERLNLGSPKEMDGALIDITREITGRVYPEYNSAETQLGRLVRKYLSFLEAELDTK